MRKKKYKLSKKMKRKELAIVGKLKTDYSFFYKKSGMEIVISYEK